MASWMVHLRIADLLLDRIPGLAPEAFIMGNIAPDSGVPNADWSAYTPSKAVSHFKGNQKTVNPAAFAAKYFSSAQRSTYSIKQYSFYLGYLVHLITDELWVWDVYVPTKEKFSAEFAADRDFVNIVKEDWYDLDYKFLRDHPGFSTFQVFSGAVGFRNEFMDEFPADAFDNRRAYISDFYLQKKDNLDRVYPYLTEQEMDDFITAAVEKILKRLDDF